MARTFWRWVSPALLSAGLYGTFVCNCSEPPHRAFRPDVPSAAQAGPVLSSGPAAAGGCPATTDAHAIDSFDFDFAKAFELDFKVGNEIKNDVAMAIATKSLADKIEVDLRIACGKVLRDLGATDGEYKDSPEACDAAARELNKAR